MLKEIDHTCLAYATARDAYGKWCNRQKVGNYGGLPLLTSKLQGLSVEEVHIRTNQMNETPCCKTCLLYCKGGSDCPAVVKAAPKRPKWIVCPFSDHRFCLPDEAGDYDVNEPYAYIEKLSDGTWRQSKTKTIHYSWQAARRWVELEWLEQQPVCPKGGD